MKKITILLLILTVLAGTVMAAGIGEGPSELLYRNEGLYVGGHFDIGDFSEAGDTMSLTPFVGYGFNFGEFGLDGLTVYGELFLPMVFKDDNDDFAVSGTLNIGADYALDLDFGKLYFGLDVPMFLFSSSDPGPDPFDTVGLNFKVGVDMGMFGGQVTVHNYITIFEETEFFFGINVLGFYRMDAITAALSVGIPTYEDGMDFQGLSFTPQVSYDLTGIVDNLTAFLGIPIQGIGVKDGDPVIGVFLGAKYKF